MQANENCLPAAFTEQKADVDDLAEIFHENTKYWPSTVAAASVNVAAFLTAPDLIERSTRGYNHFPLSRRVELPRHKKTRRAFADMLQSRASTRIFDDTPIEFGALGGVLDLACRATRMGETATGKKVYFRSYPSGGGLYPVEIYVVALNVNGLHAGVSHYNPRTHALEIVREEIAPAEVRKALVSPRDFEHAAVAIVLTSVLQRTTAKYGARGYRFALLEAGHCGQNICLAAEAQNIKSCLCGGYFDDKVAALCGADGVNEAVVSLMFLGNGVAGGGDGKQG